MASGFPSEAIWAIVNAAMSGIIIFPLFVIGVIALFKTRRRSDPVRTGFTWLKLVFPFELLAILMIVVSDALFIVYLLFILDYYTDFDADPQSLDQAQLRTSVIAEFFERIADVLMLITFVEIGTGFLAVFAGGKKVSLGKILFFVAIAAAVILTALNVATFGRVNALYSTYYSSDFNEVDFISLDAGLQVVRQLSGSFNILFFVTSLATLGLGVMVVIKSKATPLLRSSAVIFLVATIIWAIRWLWFLVYSATWGLPGINVPLAYYVVDAIFNVWFFFIVLTLLFVIGARKEKGLWSTSQPWNPSPHAGGIAPQPAYAYNQPQAYYQQPQAGYAYPQQPVQHTQAGLQPYPQQQQQQFYASPPQHAATGGQLPNEPTVRSSPQVDTVNPVTTGGHTSGHVPQAVN